MVLKVEPGGDDIGPSVLAVDGPDDHQSLGVGVMDGGLDDPDSAVDGSAFQGMVAVAPRAPT